MLDLSPIKSGGGLQLASNLLNALASGSVEMPIGAVLISDLFPRQYLIDGIETLVAPSKPLARLRYENAVLPRVVKSLRLTHSYTMFGPGLPKIANLKQLVGMAYPILVYNESDYWRYVSPSVAYRKRIQNAFRKKRLLNAHHVLFETEVMQRRAVNAGLVRGNSSVLPPTPTSFLHASQASEQDVLKVLLPTGLASHKNVWRLPEIIERIDRQGIPVKFMLTADRHDYLDLLRSLPGGRGGADIERHIEFLGSIPPHKLQHAYDRSDAVANFSDLESFSNNYMEAWVVGRPIIASKRDFSQEICGDSAIYVEPHDPDSVATGLVALVHSAERRERMVREGRRRLSQLPSMEHRLQEINRILRSI